MNECCSTAPNSTKTVHDWLQYCDTLSPAEVDLGLERLNILLAKTDWHIFDIPVVTFAGTNGKGSTIAATNALLSQQNVRVGVYTSPHLLRYNERIRICNEEVTDAELCVAFSAVEQVRGRVPLTYFEFGTLVALYLFQNAALDVVLLEVGLGGRLDAVNVVDADIAVITQLGLDHTAWLGDTLGAIAQEKAGIMRAQCPVIVAHDKPPPELKAHADTVGAVWLGREQYGYRSLETSFGEACDPDSLAWRCEPWCWYGVNRDGETVEIQPLATPHLPLVSVATSLQVLQLLLPMLTMLPKLSQPALALLQPTLLNEAMSAMHLPGRMTYVSAPKGLAPVLLDVAHNKQSVRYLSKRLYAWQQGMMDSLLGRYVGKKVVAVFGALEDKPVIDMITEMKGVIDQWVPICAFGPRAMSEQAILEKMVECDIESILRERSPGNAVLGERINHLLSTLRRQDDVELVVVFGSFYLVGPAMTALSNQPMSTRID